jgi:hypothetical protein
MKGSTPLQISLSNTFLKGCIGEKKKKWKNPKPFHTGQLFWRNTK